LRRRRASTGMQRPPPSSDSPSGLNMCSMSRCTGQASSPSASPTCALRPAGSPQLAALQRAQAHARQRRQAEQQPRPPDAHPSFRAVAPSLCVQSAGDGAPPRTELTAPGAGRAQRARHERPRGCTATACPGGAAAAAAAAAVARPGACGAKRAPGRRQCDKSSGARKWCAHHVVVGRRVCAAGRKLAAGAGRAGGRAAVASSAAAAAAAAAAILPARRALSGEAARAGRGRRQQRGAVHHHGVGQPGEGGLGERKGSLVVCRRRRAQRVEGRQLRRQVVAQLRAPRCRSQPAGGFTQGLRVGWCCVFIGRWITVHECRDAAGHLCNEITLRGLGETRSVHPLGGAIRIAKPCACI